MQFEDAFFDVIGRHLLRTPEASARVLRSMADGAPVTFTAAESEAIDRARSWLDAVLKPDFAPAPDVSFAAFAQEEGVCDTVRGLYSADGLSLSTAQSRHVLAIKVRGFPSDTSMLKTAEGLADKILRVPDDRLPVVFELAEEQGGVAYGHLVDPVLDDATSSWLDAIRWWCAGDLKGFVTIKKPRARSRAVISPDAHDNRLWFSRLRSRDRTGD